MLWPSRPCIKKDLRLAIVILYTSRVSNQASPAEKPTPSGARLRYLISRALVPINQPARTGVWIGRLWQEVSKSDEFESYLEFCYEVDLLARKELLDVQFAKIAKPQPDPRLIYPHMTLVKVMRQNDASPEALSC